MNSPRITAQQLGLDFNQMLQNAKGGQTRTKIQRPQDLKPVVYSIYSKTQSEALRGDNFSAAYYIEQKEKELRNLKNATGFRKSQKEKQKRGFSSTFAKFGTKNEISRRALLTEIGGFHQKTLLSTFYKQMGQRQIERRTASQKQQGPSEEFLKKQKQKLRDLMLQNSEIENRRNLKAYLAQKKVQQAEDSIEGGEQKPLSEPMLQEDPPVQLGSIRSDGQPPDLNTIRSVQQQQPMRPSLRKIGGSRVSLDQTQSRFGGPRSALHLRKKSIETTGYYENQPRHSKLNSIGSAGSLKSFGSNKKSVEPGVVKNNMKIHDRKQLKQFWITGPSIQLNLSQGTATGHQNPDGDDTALEDKSTKYTLQQKLQTSHELESCIHQAIEDTHFQEQSQDTKIKQKLTSVIRSHVEKPNVDLSENERQFLGINSSLKGYGVSSHFHKQVTKSSLQTCFLNQKQAFLDTFLKKKVIKQKEPAESNDTSQMGSNKDELKDAKEDHLSSKKLIKTSRPSDSHLKKEEEPSEIVQAEKKEIDLEDPFNFPTGETERHLYILRQIELDNLRDIEDPFVCLNEDIRVFKISKKPYVSKPEDRLRNFKIDFQDSTFWFLKGFDHGELNEMDSAIDSYRQAIRLNTKNAEAMMNLAAQYEAQQRYEVAAKWYKMAIILKPELSNAYYGYALCQFKSGNAQDASDHLTTAIYQIKDVDINDRTQRHMIYFRYLRAMCFKQLKEFEKSQEDYRNILRAIEIEEGSKFAKYIFAMILMPVETNRKKLLEYVDGFKSILDLYEDDKSRRILSNYYINLIDKNQVYIGDNHNHKWLDKKIPEIIRTLQRRSFFKRFSLQRIVEMLERMDLKLIDKKDILFFQPDKVYVIVSGNIIMKNHESVIQLPMTCAKFGEGDILNFMQEDSELFNSLETWFFAQVESEIAVFDRDYFQSIWDVDVMTEKLMMWSSLVSAQPLFQQLSKLTVMMLVSEVFSVRKFKKGDIIIPQSKYSPTNSRYRQYYEIRLSKFAETLRQKKNKADMGQGKAHSKLENYQPDEDKVGRQKSAGLRTNEIKEIEKLERTAARFNFKSRKKQTLEKVLGISEDIDQDQITNMSSSAQKKDREMMLMSPEGSKAPTHMSVQTPTNGMEEIGENEDPNDGFYLITQGTYVVRNHDDQYQSKTLKQGDYFGESDLLKNIGYTFYGEIVADSDDLECWFVKKKDFSKIPLYEQIHMKENAMTRRDILMLSFEYSRRYKIEIKEYSSYYG